MAIFATMNRPKVGLGNGRSGYTDWPRTGIKVTAESGGLKVVTPYSSAFVDALKTEVPATSRKWDGASKAWLVSKQYSDKIKEIIDRCYNVDCQMPTVIGAAEESFEVTFQADYVANCKNDASSVWSNGGWNAKIPESILRKWFHQEASSDNSPATLYGVLGVDKSCSDLELKKAYKRAARQWHPDICREENAREMFEKVKAAYDTLGDPMQRQRYDAGLMFEEMAKQGPRFGRGYARRAHPAVSFTPTLRCGMLKVKAHKELGVLIVEEILAWDDITNELGQTMVSFWAGDSWTSAWV